MSHEVTATYDLIEEMELHNAQYDNPRGQARKGGKYEVDNNYANLATRVDAVVQRLDNMNFSGS